MSEKPRVFYEFGPFRLDEGERRLLRDGEEVVLREGGREERLRPKAFDLLLALVKRRGRMAGRGELMEELWPGTFVEDNRLSDNVSTLRKFLGDRPRDPHYIETVHKHGYRFVAEVRESQQETAGPARRAKTGVAAGGGRWPMPKLAGSNVNPNAAQRAASRPRPACAACRPPSPFAVAAACVLLCALAFAAYYAVKGDAGSAAETSATVPSQSAIRPEHAR